MRHHIAVKFMAVFLAALSLFAAAASAIGVICLASENLYEDSVDKLYEEEMAATCREFSVNLIHRYATLELGNIPENYLQTYHNTQVLYNTFEYGQYFYVIRNENGAVVESTVTGDLAEAAKYEINVTDIRYRRLVQGAAGTTEGADAADTVEDSGILDGSPNTMPNPSEPSASGEDTVNTPESTPGTETDAAQTPAVVSEEDQPKTYQDGYYDYELDTYVELQYQFANLPPYTVELYLLPDAVPDDPLWNILKTVWQYRYDLFYSLGIGLFLFAATAVYLCCAAGRSPKSDEIRPGGLNRIPLDLYAFVTFLGSVFVLSIGFEAIYFLARYQPQLLTPFIALTGYGICLVIVGFFFACAAQFKTPQGFWWRHSVTGFVLIRIVRFIRLILRGLRSVARMLPVIWQWLLTAFVMVLCVAVSLLMLIISHGIFQVFWLLVFAATVLGCIAVVCYGGWCFGTLIRGAQYMAQGNLYYQIPTRYLFGAFRDFAIQLNSLAGAAQIAAQRQLRSERMKTELITNVSHDIKTPLTSIINYVDLLKLPHTDEEAGQYLEVIDRQSQRLKKLVEDLMEMSKASTGNMTVEVSRMDAAETINQVLGEFSDKLARAGLTPVFRAPEETVYMMADGRLVWRVMSNLLGNAVKYAMPNTRLYIDLLSLEGRVIISLKNISREELNVNADELLERFVRGDLSRNTEGSGLGLNIAQSLMELQKGKLQLLVDGDLFKVNLVFPSA